ncbi:MAG TPA: potassium/proton antiporter [Solirubrobacteraceae bacterium]|jgi:cell volume regulation protein A
MTHDAELILFAGALLGVGIAASLLATRLRLPALVLFLGLGMLIGSDGLGWIDFNNYPLARLIGTIALVLIMFDGGLSAGWGEIRPVLRSALRLAVAGTIVTALVAGLAAAWLFGFSPLEGLLLGAILAATDSAAVFALMRGTRLPTRLRRTLEGEAGFNDPVAVLLLLVVIELIQTPHYDAGDVAVFLLQQVGVGVAVGVGTGRLAIAAMGRRAQLPTSLALVASFATAAISYGAAGALGGSGFVAVYLTGLALGSAPLRHKHVVLAFHEGLASVAEIGMFLALGLLVFPSQLGDVAVKGILLALITAFVARPLGVALATWKEGFSRRERALLGWAGLRGAVPVILATFPVIRHVPDSLEFFNIIFFAVLLSATIQGLTIQPFASQLGIATRPVAQADADHSR